MSLKLALRNVRRSVRDYAVYFVTLVLGVAVFYAFNSVQSQSVLFDLGQSGSDQLFALTGQFLGMFSVVVACVLGFLVVYANRFLIRRRKQEFGTYLLLGMSPARVSSIVVAETACVGVASLVLGLVLGVALSQGLSFLTAGLFNVPMQQYRFVFSQIACVQTLACFAVIFVIVALFNTFSVRRCKLIDLLSAKNRNERFRVRNPWISLAGFVVSLGVLAASYLVLIDNGLVYIDKQFALATVLMVVGTFLFFWSVAGFVLAVVERTRGLYFRGLAMFTMRQIASKVNTAFVSLSVVCVIVFLSLTTFSTGTGLVRMFTGNLEESTLFDASLSANVYLATQGVNEQKVSEMKAEDADAAAAYVAESEARSAAVIDDYVTWGGDIAARLADAVPSWNDFVEKTAQIDLYQPKEATDTYGEVMDRLGVSLANADQEESLRAQSVVVVSETQFNAVRALAGREAISVGDGGFAMANAIDLTDALAHDMAKSGTRIEVAGETLEATGECVTQALSTGMFTSDAVTLVVPDRVVEAARAAGELPTMSYLNLQYATDRGVGDASLSAALAYALPSSDEQARVGLDFLAAQVGQGESAGTHEELNFASVPWPVTLSFTAQEVFSQAGGMRMLITYLALYIGFVFLIATAAILAIQQLSEASDSLPRYRLLAQLGCDRRMVMGSLRTQVLVYFLAPLVLAICHTVCAVGVLSKSLFSALGISVAEPALMAALLVVVVYGGYLVVTYYASRGIVRASLGKRLLG